MAAGALALLLLAAGPASATPETPPGGVPDDSRPEAAPAPPGAAPRADGLPDDAVEGNIGPMLRRGELALLPEEAARARAERLDALFAELADPRNENWEVVQGQIISAWRKSGSASMDLLLERGIEAVERGNLDAALGFLSDLVRLAPDFAEGWNQRASVYFLKGQYGYSMADIERALALEPRHFAALSGLGIILDRTGNEKGALRVFRQVIEIHPHMPGAKEGIERLAPDVDGRDL